MQVALKRESCETRVSCVLSSWSTGGEELLAWTVWSNDVYAIICPQTALFNENNHYSTTLRAVMCEETGLSLDKIRGSTSHWRVCISWTIRKSGSLRANLWSDAWNFPPGPVS